jgi:hypothetical protein
MELLMVMISSVIDAMKLDREAARQGVTDSGVGKAWLFESELASNKALEDSYLDTARKCDVFILLVGGDTTEPVHKELDAAEANNRAVLVFVKSGSTSSESVVRFLKRIDRKYQPYESPAELRDLVRRTLIAHVVEAVKASRESGDAMSAVRERIRDLARRRVSVRIIPAIPHLRENDLYQALEVREGRLLVQKFGNNQLVPIPENRILAAYSEASGPNWCIDVNGRLQWTDPDQAWHFMPELPDPKDPYGYWREVAYEDAAVKQLEAFLQSRGTRTLWKVETKAKSGEGITFDLVYDRDGRYLRRLARPNYEVLVRVLRDA